MYCEFYKLKEKPFNVTSDSSFFFLSRNHKEALAHLFYGVEQRKGIIVITGEIGTGKTTLCRFFLNQLDKKVKTAFVLNPYFSQAQLLQAIAKDFGLKIKSNAKLDIIDELNKFLLKEAHSGNNVVLIIDEAQNLNARHLEQIRLLSNLETEKHKLLQTVLVGQPELNDRLSLYELRQLTQRIMVRYHITTLGKDEVKKYINHRLEIAGGTPKRIRFDEGVFEGIFVFSSGTPRLINILCDRALLAGFVARCNVIDSQIIKRSLEELESYYTLQKA